MNHEQKRPDAMQEYHGKGPHLIINWDMIEPGWESQWYGDDESYIGSTDDGAGDPRVGYAPYDWDSIMHYPLQGKGTTNPPGNEHRLGARTIASTLSPGDIRQVHDMCKIPHKCCLFMTISSVLSVVSFFFSDQCRATGGGQRSSHPPASIPCYDMPYCAELGAADCSLLQPNYAKVNRDCQALCRGRAPPNLAASLPDCGPDCARVVDGEYVTAPCFTALAASSRGQTFTASVMLPLDPEPGAPHTLQPAAFDGFCLTVNIGSSPRLQAAGDSVDLTGCSSQIWTATPGLQAWLQTGDGRLRLEGSLALCATVVGSAVQLANCAAADVARFDYTPDGHIRHQGTTNCITAADADLKSSQSDDPATGREPVMVAACPEAGLTLASWESEGALVLGAGMPHEESGAARVEAVSAATDTGGPGNEVEFSGRPASIKISAGHRQQLTTIAWAALAVAAAAAALA